MSADTTADLVQAFLLFTRAVIARWRTELEAAPDEQEDRRAISPTFLAPRHMAVLQPRQSELAQLVEAKQMVEAHARAGQYSFPEGWERIAATEGSIAWARLLEYLTQAFAAVIQYHGLDPSDDEIASIYTCYMDAWTSKQIDYYIFSPVFNLRLDDYTKQYSIGDKYAIKLMDSEDVALFPEARNEMILPILKWDEPWLVITCSHFATEASNVNVQAFMDDVQSIIWAMRLVQPGYVSAPYIFAHARGPSPDVEHHFVTLNTHQDLEARRVPYGDLPERREKVTHMLGDDTMSRIQDVYEQLKELRMAGSNYGGLGFALRRFNLAFSRNAEDDRLIDLVTALDSVLGSGSQTELQYRISLRAAALLAQEGYDPSLVQTHLQAIYTIRSSVVHTGKRIQDCGTSLKKLKMRDAGAVTETCLDYTRAVMHYYVSATHRYLVKPDERPETDRKMTDAELVTDVIDKNVLVALKTVKYDGPRNSDSERGRLQVVD